MTTLESIKAARRCGTPLIIIRTADPNATIKRIEASPSFGKAQEEAVIQWDVVQGARGFNTPSKDVLDAALRSAEMDPAQTTNPTEFIVFTSKLPKFSIVCMINLHRWASDDIGVIQALSNVRDEFKAKSKTIIGLVPNITLPAELSQDVLVLDEPLPTDAELKAIAVATYNSAQIPEPDAATMDKIVDATLGLAAFPAEQAMSMSITKKGIDIEELWDRKRSLVAQTDGLSVPKPEITMDDVEGVKNAKQFLMRVMNGAEPPRCYVFIDEGEKSFAGSSVSGGDSSGVTQNFLGTFLTRMQERKYNGVIFVGFPGSAKSMLAKATGATAGVPTIHFDMAGMKNSLVGASEANLRRALDTIDAVSQGRAYFIMTSNGIATLPPELKRRFKDAIFFFDIPDRQEKDAIWALYLKQYADRLAGLDLKKPEDTHWTGAEISTCVHNAYRFKISLVEASAYIVPSYLSMGEDKARRLREEASGRFISASYPGPYQSRRSAETPVSSTSRTIVFDEGAN